MNWEIFISALFLGGISSFHCIGMCGPIAFSLPIHHLYAPEKIAGILLYNTGRIVSYTILGTIFGLVGRAIYMGGFEQWFSISLGSVILIIVLQSILTKKIIHLNFLNKFNKAIQLFIGTYIRERNIWGMFLIGMANGFLPCGMVYFAIAGALATSSLSGGILFMASYGLGTIPLMALLSYFGFLISLPVRNKMRSIVPYFLACMAVLLILRGLNLGIPYLSPQLVNNSSKVISCH